MNLLSRLLSKNSRRKSKLKHSRRGFLETLEHRQLMVASVLSTTPSLVAGSVATGNLTLQVNFSGPVTGGNLAANYDLRRAGTDGLLNTVDDAVITPSSVTYSGNTATLNVTGLVEDSYLLTVKDTILDAATNTALDGDGDGIAGRSFYKDFLVGANIKATGSNSNGVFGNGTTTSSTTFVSSANPTDLIAMRLGYFHAVALKSDGTVWTWGYNSNGQLGDGTTTSHTVPAIVPSLSNVVAIEAGENSSWALKSDGTVWGWGYASSGLGNGSTSSLTPVQITGVTNVTSIAVGDYHVLALQSDGTLKAWGYNLYGQLGDGTTTSRSTPVTVPGLTNIKNIFADNNTSQAVLTDGTMRGWGQYVGNGSSSSQSVPTQVTGLTTVLNSTAGYSAGYAITSSGVIQGWGNNIYGGLGDGTTTSHYGPAPITGVSNAVGASAGYYNVLIQLRDGTVKAAGYNSSGDIGLGSTTSTAIATTVANLNCVRTTDVTYWDFALALRNTPVTPLSFYHLTPVTQTTNADSLVYQVKFNDDVYGLDTADFNVTGTTATVTNVTMVNRKTYNVTISGGDLANLNGTVALSFAGSATASDRFNVPVVMNQPVAVENYSILNSPQVNAITRFNPTTSSTNLASVIFKVSFSEAVSGVDAGDFVITAPGATGTSVTNITTADQINYNVTVATGLGTGTLRLDFNASTSGGVTSVASGSISNTNFTTGQTYDLHRSTPTAIALDHTSVAENLAKGTSFASLSATDADPGETFTYALVTGAGSTDNTAFTILGTALKTNAVFNYETKNSYSVRLRVTDSSGLTYEQPFTISITDVNEAPTAIALLNKTKTIDQSVNTTNPTTVATIQVTDDALGTNNLSLSGADAAFFQISGNQLQLISGATLDNQANPVLDVIVIVDDPTVGSTPDATVAMSISVTDQPPIAVIQQGSDTVVFGTSGNDRIYITVLDTEVHVYVNSDMYVTTADDQSVVYVYGKAGNDYISLLKTSDSQLPLIIDGGAGNDTIYGGAGNDTLIGGTGNDRIYAGEGDNIVWGDKVDEWVSGVGAGNDTITAGGGNDLLYGGGGNDTIQAGAGDDTLYGGDGIDSLNGGTGNDVLRGGTGKDTLTGGTGDDILIGGAGNDYLYGNDGNDMLIGGTGKDILSGSTGDDILLGGSISAFEDQTEIDFTQLADRALIGLLFEWFTPGTLFERRDAVLASGDFAPEDDGEKDTLSGDAGSDWILAGTLDIVPSTSGDLRESI